MQKYTTFFKNGQKTETLAESRQAAYKHVQTHYGADNLLDFLGSTILNIILDSDFITDDLDNTIVPELNEKEVHFFALDGPSFVVEICNLKYSKIKGNNIELTLDEGGIADIFLFNAVAKDIVPEML